VLIVDLNNFSTFPTLAVGLLVASLRNAAFDVRLISPLANDVPATERERAETLLDHAARRVHLSTWGPFRTGRDTARRLRRWWLDRPHARVLAETERALSRKPDILLLSAYLQHYETVVELGKLARRHGVPVLLGGPMFNQPETAEAWRTIPGVTAVVGVEADTVVPDLVTAVCEGRSLSGFDGVVTSDGSRSAPAGPFRQLDQSPTPDFTDFPWDRYRVRIIPIMAARGCQWNRCNFCSDIVSVSGRTFRSRSVDHVLHEMREQARRHGTNNFLFLDLKLNSNPGLFRGIVENVQRNVPGAQWIGTVHVDRRRDNGLSRSELKAAVAAGMRRVSFGLETGSQRLLDAMDKGCTVEGNSEFIRNAHDVGLSVRCTMMKGFPGERAEDLERTADFLEAHLPYLDRVRFNDFSLPAGTPIADAVRESPEQYANFKMVRLNARQARVGYINTDGRDARYRKAKARTLRAVYAINRRKLRSSARNFDGLM
jgi:radical SAM superfamily enzyme YgiQ (UPF0313 family)